MRGPNRFKLGVFSANADGGLTLTRVPERWRADGRTWWRWRRWPTARGWSFFCRSPGGRALAASRTVANGVRDVDLGRRARRPDRAHRTVRHRACADGASGVRGQGAGDDRSCRRRARRAEHRLRLEPRGVRLFGLQMIEDRYGQGLEWFEILERIYTERRAIRLQGAVLRSAGVSGKPLPVQRPRPVTLNAAFSPPGRDFAARAADCLFTTFVEIGQAVAQIDDMRVRAAAAGREVGVYTTCHVVCRPSQEEAEDVLRALRRDNGGHRGRRPLHGRQRRSSPASHDPAAYRLHRKRFAGGAGTYPLVGTPRQIAEEMVRMAAWGSPERHSRSSITRASCRISSRPSCLCYARLACASKKRLKINNVNCGTSSQGQGQAP